MSTHASMPSSTGRFGAYGGRYVPETLIAALDELTTLYTEAKADPTFWTEFQALMRNYVGRPTPLYHARRLTAHARQDAPKAHGAEIYLKREDLAHTGAHKINNTIGQALLTRRMGKQRVIAETGAGQHGVASATAAAHFGLDCHVYMGAEDARRQRLNVIRMKMLGAEVIEVDSGSRTLKDATNEAMRDWMGSVESTHYILGSVVGPHPFPMIVRDFQSIIGNELKQQFKAQGSQSPGPGAAPDHTPDDSNPTDSPSDAERPTTIIACVGGGSNAAGIFYPFIDTDVRLVGVEAGGSAATLGHHAAPLNHGAPGVLHGSLSYVLQDEWGQTADVHSCSAGLDYPGVGPEHSYWKDAGRVEYTFVTDAQALDAFQLLARTEGIIPALETAHAIAKAIQIARDMSADDTIVVNLSGRGDKDVDEAARLMNL